VAVTSTGYLDLLVCGASIANAVSQATDQSKQERKLTRAKGARLPSARAGDLPFLFFVAREKKRAHSLQ